MRTFREILTAFGVFGWIELFAACVVALGCAGEMWLLINKLPPNTEPLPEDSGVLWRWLHSTDRTLRPLLVRLKLGGRKLPEAKEHLLERFFTMLVAVGVGIEFVALPFSLFEIARLNVEASNAAKDSALAKKQASDANERTAVIESTNKVLSLKIEELTAENLKMYKEIQPRRITATQKKFLALLLSNAPKGKIVLSVNDPHDTEAVFFAIQLEDALKSAGFTDIKRDISVVAFGGDTFTGIVAQTTSGDRMPEFAVDLSEALAGIGIPFNFQKPQPTLPLGVLGIRIGTKTFPDEK